MISEHDIDRARQSDIVSIVRARIQIKKTGKNWSGCCPFHKDKSPSFTVSEHKSMYYCFGCGAGGGAIDFVMAYDGVSFPAAVESINGGLTLESSGSAPRPQTVRAITCSLPGHAEDREKSAAILARCKPADQHPYLFRSNTAPHTECLTLKGALIVPLINNIGETVNLAAISADGTITYAAGKPSYGSTAVLEPRDDIDIGMMERKVIICADYAHACRIWWVHSGYARVLCAIDHGNFLWMLANCKDRFTHVGCDPSEADEHYEMGRAVVAVPVDPYSRLRIVYGDSSVHGMKIDNDQIAS